MRFLIGLLAILFFSLPAVILAHSEVKVIEMTPSGFEPSEAVVDQNSSIIFINKDKEPRWPASNIHPTHDLYPEFDPQKAIQPGESWAFKPQKEGEWKYHDHLKPHLRGALTVISEDGEKTPTLTWQQNFKDFIQQVISKIKNIFSFAKQEDGVKRWQDLKQKYKSRAGSEGDIHDSAHLAGSLIYKQKGFDGIADCSPDFAFGCYHGFLDEAFKKDLSKLADAHDACSKLGSGLTGPVASCIHGIGHGVVSFYGTDLKKSLASCRKLTSGSEFCFDGVFMEYARSAPESAFKKNDPYFPCSELEKEFGPVFDFACGRNQPSLLMQRLGKKFDEVVQICRSSTSKKFQEACFDSLGFSLAASGDEQQIIQGCGQIGILELTRRCIVAAAGELIFQEVPGWETKSENICQSIPAQEECLDHLERLIKEYGRKKKINFTPIKSSEDENRYVQREIKKCYDQGGRDGCYKEVADLFYGQFGLKKTLAVLKENESHPEVYARCHEVTHYLSRHEYDQKQSIAKVYAECDSTCHGGCYHGVLEAYLKKDPSADFAKICGKSEDYQKPIEFNECLHGLGHAGMFIYDMELKKSLVLCDSLIEHEYIDRCYTGVFMENSSSSTSFDHASKYIKADDPFYPCNSLEEKYQSVCWQYQSSYFSIISGQDWKKVADLCLQIPEKYQDKCFRTIGTNQVGFTQSLGQMKKDCDLMPSAHFKNICVAGVVSSLSYRFVGDSQKMVDFCNVVDQESKEGCFKQMGTGLLEWNTSKDLAKSECQKISDPNEKLWCLSDTTSDVN